MILPTPKTSKCNNILFLFSGWLFVFILLVSINFSASAQTFLFKATLYEQDSFSKIPFAVVSIKGKMDATFTDESGNFEIPCRLSDTLVISHITYKKHFIPIRKLADSTQKRVKIYLKRKDVELSAVTISGKRLSKEKKEEYQRHLERVRPTISSPISAIYESVSRRGKERSKMDEIYEDLLRRDMLEQRLPPRKLFLITNDRSVKLDDLLILCPVTGYFVKNASDYVFFYHFSQCWDQYKNQR